MILPKFGATMTGSYPTPLRGRWSYRCVRGQSARTSFWYAPRVLLRSLLVRAVAGLAALLVAGSASAQTVESDGTGEAEEAQDEDARLLFERGNEAYADVRYEDALGYFEAAYALTSRPELQFNIGLCLERLDRDAEAIAAFERYLLARPDAANADNVRARIRVAREQMARDLEHSTQTSTSESGSLLPGLLTSVAGAAVAIGGGVMIGVGLNTISDVEATEVGSTTWSAVQSDADRGVTLQTVGWIALGVGITAAVVGLVIALAGGD